MEWAVEKVLSWLAIREQNINCDTLQGTRVAESEPVTLDFMMLARTYERTPKYSIDIMASSGAEPAPIYPHQGMTQSYIGSKFTDRCRNTQTCHPQRRPIHNTPKRDT